VSLIFHHKYRVIQSAPESKVINKRDLTLLSFSLTSEHPLIIYVRVVARGSNLVYSVSIYYIFVGTYRFTVQCQETPPFFIYFQEKIKEVQRFIQTCQHKCKCSVSGKKKVWLFVTSLKVSFWSELLYSPTQPEPSYTSFLSFL